MKRIVVVGGGVAGTLTANYLASHLRDEIREKRISITLISDKDKQLYEPGLLYLIFNRLYESDIFMPIKYLVDPLIDLKIETATKIDLDNEKVYTDKNSYDYDYLVIATGSRVVPEEIPGLTEAGYWFYNYEGAVKLREALANFAGGKIVVSVMGVSS